MQCPKCQHTESRKNGIVLKKQRYKCRHCGCNYTRSDRHGRPVAQKILAVTLHLSGMSLNSIGVVLGVTAQSVMRWVRWAAETFAPLPSLASDSKVHEIEMDEMHHFLLKKLKNSGSGKCWITTLDAFAPGVMVLVIPQPDKKRS